MKIYYTPDKFILAGLVADWRKELNKVNIFPNDSDFIHIDYGYDNHSYFTYKPTSTRTKQEYNNYWKKYLLIEAIKKL
jgi:hypothetical protein